MNESLISRFKNIKLQMAAWQKKKKKKNLLKDHLLKFLQELSAVSDGLHQQMGFASLSREESRSVHE